MHVRSLGYRTDLIFPRFDGVVEERDRSTIVRTPSNLGFYWGNFLLFEDAPKPGDLLDWTERFRAEVGGEAEGVRHIALGWDSPDGEAGANAGEFLAAGFEMDRSIVLTADSASIHPSPKHNESLEVVSFSSQDSSAWDAALELALSCRQSDQGEIGAFGNTVENRRFAAAQMERRRAMAGAGRGAWFGAYADARLVGQCGVFSGDRLGADGYARFQSVETHPDYRRRGVCGALVYAAARHALATLGARTLVIVADPDYHAAAIYRSLGFAQVERSCGLLRPPC